jgi:hypothetical protein
MIDARKRFNMFNEFNMFNRLGAFYLCALAPLRALRETKRSIGAGFQPVSENTAKTENEACI